jgi:L-ascorbate metabolism protein UlaG (beta-lactamase superfamily)
MIYFLLIIATLGLTFYLIAFKFMSAPAYKGPISDHFDGNEFRNIDNVPQSGMMDVLKWQLNSQNVKWGEFRNQPLGTTPPAKVDSGILVTYVNHSTVLIQVDGLNILTDPVWYERVSPFQFMGPKRNCPPGLRLEDLPRIDLVLQSHNHWDHLDIETAKAIGKKHNPLFITPLGVGQFLTQNGIIQTHDMDWWDVKEVNENVKIHCVPAQHFTGRGLADRNKTLWAGYVIESEYFGKIYFAGDTGYGSFFKTIGERFGGFDLSLIPIGAYKPNWFMSPVHCSPAEAVQIHEDIKSKQSMAIHFGTFDLADEGEFEPIEDLRKALKAKNISNEDFFVLKEGGNSKDLASRR